VPLGRVEVLRVARPREIQAGDGGDVPCNTKTQPTVDPQVLGAGLPDGVEDGPHVDERHQHEAKVLIALVLQQLLHRDLGEDASS
jgi:hypothetical protein